MGIAVCLQPGDLAERLPSGEPSGPEVSAVVPCLNEAETPERCIESVQRAFREHQTDAGGAASNALRSRL